MINLQASITEALDETPGEWSRGSAVLRGGRIAIVLEVGPGGIRWVDDAGVMHVSDLSGFHERAVEEVELGAPDLSSEERVWRLASARNLKPAARLAALRTLSGGGVSRALQVEVERWSSALARGTEPTRTPL